jgi:acetyltransferase-like isoleucine patch superfamily enzyme
MGRRGTPVNWPAVLYNKIVYRPVIRLRLKAVGRRFRLGYASEVINPHLFSFGDNVFTGPHCYFVTNEYSPVKIGNHVMFGPYCKIVGGNHDYRYAGGPLAMHDRPMSEIREIVIEDGVWIGADSMVLTGASIGEGAVIGAMGLVNHWIPPYTVAVGVPARRFFRRFVNDEALEEALRNADSLYTVDLIREMYRQCGVEMRNIYALQPENES